LREATEDRLRIYLGRFGPYLAPLLLCQLPWRAGVSAEQLQPIKHLAAIDTPLLLASGTADRHTTESETRRLFAEAAAPKSLWLVEGAAHVDLYDYAGQDYAQRIEAFLGQHLRGSATGPLGQTATAEKLSPVD
jgi:fermentation-respiration switch protein FrsA (DUF1100 family)